MNPAGRSGELDCAWMLSDPGTEAARPDVRVAWHDGRLTAIEPVAQPVPGPRRLVLPALVNAHDHARTFRSATLGAYGQPLESWLPYLGVLPGVDPYVCAASSLARSARQGAVQVMVHYTRVQGLGPYLDEALAVARAAADVGVRIGFAVAMRDRHGIAYAPDDVALNAIQPGIRQAIAQRMATPCASVAEQLEQVELLAQAAAGGAATVQYGPTGVQWCTDALLEGVARASHDYNRGVHMHLLETRYQREWADHALPGGIVRHLDDIGLLSPRLTLAHCTWCRPDELELLAERGVTIAVNTSSNLGLNSGVAPLREMVRLGCRVAMGLDGMAFDEDDDALREMRLAHALHRGTGYDSAFPAATLWAFAARHGRHAVTGDGGNARLEPGQAADLMVLDWERLDDDALWPDIDPLHLLLSRANGSYIDTVVSSGRTIVQAGRVVTVDEAGLRAEVISQTRAALARHPEAARWRATVNALAGDLSVLYRAGLHCGCC